MRFSGSTVESVDHWSQHFSGQLAYAFFMLDKEVTIQLLQLGHWGLPLERQDKRVEKIVGLFAADRKVEVDDGKGIPAGFGAETTGDFLLEFWPSQVAFGLVVVEENAPVSEEAQDLVAVLAQSPNEVAGRGLFDTPAGAWTTGTGRIASFGVGEDGVVAGPQALDSLVGNALKSCGPVPGPR